MRIVLEFHSGPSPTPKIWLRDGQIATFGRTSQADFSVAGDERMSALHFCLECQANACWIKDLGSTNGTFVNGHGTREAMLHDLDTIHAGKTCFVVHLSDELRATSSCLSLPDQQASAGSLGERKDAPTSLPTRGRSPDEETIKASARSSTTSPPWPAPQRVELLCLEVQEGATPRKIWLQPGMMGTLGRGPQADYNVEGDETISAAHFLFACDTKGCRVRDLGSTGGTFLNGQRISDGLLHQGDTILAGRTKFIVQIRYERERGGPGVSPPVEYTMTRCASGAFLFQGCAAEPAAADLARKLAESLPLHLLVNLTALARPPVTQPVFLIDWVSLSVASQLSPIVLSPSDPVDPYEVLQEAWGKDALVCVFSRLETPRLLAHLRTVARGQCRPGDIPLPEHIVGSFQPSQLAKILTTGLPEFAKSVFDGVEAFLIEPQLSPHWEFLAGRGFADALTSIGFSPRTPPPAPTASR